LMFAIAGNDSHFVAQCTWRRIYAPEGKGLAVAL
jgi:hypothetical protein